MFDEEHLLPRKCFVGFLSYSGNMNGVLVFARQKTGVS